MARPIRHVVPHHYYMLTNRCVLGQFVLRPDQECRRIIKGCLARAVVKYDVRLVCFVFMSNHFHLIARFPGRNMSEFMGEFQSQIASRINDHRDRKAKVFPERFDDQVLLDADALEDKIAYVLNNPVKDGLVPYADDWPGVSSFDLHVENKPLEGRWLNGQTWTKLKRRKADYDREAAMETYTVDLHLPEALGDTRCFRDEACDGGEVLEESCRQERLERILEIVDRDRRRLWKRMTGSAARPPRGTFSPKEIETMDWRRMPTEAPASSDRRRLCVGSSLEAIEAYREKRGAITENYRQKSAAWRAGRRVRPTDFPVGTYPPTCRHCVRPADGVA